MDEKVQVVRATVEAFSAGDLESLRKLFADDVVVHVPPGLPVSGDHRGFDAFLGDMIGKVVGTLGSPPQVHVHDFTHSEDHVVGIYTIRAERDGKRYEWRHVNVYHVSNGRVSEFWWNPFDWETVREALSGQQ